MPKPSQQSFQKSYNTRAISLAIRLSLEKTHSLLKEVGLLPWAKINRPFEFDGQHPNQDYHQYGK